mmetsp:Transcript_46804/g.122887  ORF Transcript_46804/g.122887 Transcript_46804/m.122887 type:complete len:192 (-) Transcript_46804:526-1101(-)
MGIFKTISSMLGLGSALGGKKVRIICVGLDNSGKTTIISHLKPKKAMQQDIVPTVGFTVEEFQKNGLAFTVFDMSGQGRYRNLWEHYYKDVGGIIFCIDSTDAFRMCVAKDELEAMLAHQDLNGVPLLFYANKMDLPTAKQPVECVQLLELDKMTDKPWHIAASNALTGEGIENGIAWLADQMSRAQRSGR